MQRSHFVLIVVLLFTWMLSACVVTPPPGEEIEMITADSPTPAPDLTTPDIVEGKFNAAFVYVGPIGDGGWSYAHNTGRLYLEEQMPEVHTAYLESIPEGADAERVIRNLARKGFDVIFTTSFGYMDPTETVAAEFPDQYFVHISGFKRNDSNFANLFGALEMAEYLAGMVAGAKAAEDGSYRVGSIAPFPIAEVIRLSNARTLGMRRTCPTCVMDIRWIFTWFDPEKEAEAAASLLDAGATVVATGADTAIPVQVAAERGMSGMGKNSANTCAIAPDACLGGPYWTWGPAYVSFVEDIMAGEFVADDYYLDFASSIVGFAGFMEGEVPFPAVPDAVIPEVDDVIAQMLDGTFTRFDIFTGPLNDNKGNEIVPADVSLTQSDLEGIDQGLAELLGRPACTYCMNWLVEGFVEDAEVPQ